jgi:predicted RNA-binding protein with TRAM domain
LTNGTTYTFKVSATTSVGTGPTSTPSNPATPQATVSCPCTVLGSATPATIDSNDPSGVNLGMAFTTDTNGFIAGVRFYKAPANGGTHIGSLWSQSGTLLASATFTNETASGWQQVNFSTPVAVTAGTTYVVSYLAPGGHYSVTGNGFSTMVSSPPLYGLASGSTTPNGVFTYGSGNAFPTSTYNASNYSVDVVFTTSSGTAPGAPTGVTATAGNGSATVSWTAPPANGNPITSYTVTPYVGSTAGTPTNVVGSPPATTANVTGLTNGTTYTFAVTATSAAGTSVPSAPSNSVTPTAPAPPGAPTGVTATAGNGSVTVSWTAPGSGASAITSYTVTPYVGSTAGTPTNVVGSPPATTANVTGLTNGTTYTFKVSATSSIGTGPASAASNLVTPRAAVTCPCTVLGTATPTMVDSGDSSSVNLGMAFTTDTNGLVTGVRFYKSVSNTGSHVGSLWSSSGALLASATFTSETASGWQQVNFSTPVAVTAGTTYIVSYLAPNGHYSATSNGLATTVSAPPLYGLASSSSTPNGVYFYSSNNAFPTSTYNATNYYVDPVFLLSSGTLPSTPTGVTAIAGSGAVSVSWTAPYNGASTITSYVVTPYAGSTAGTATVVTGTPAPTTANVTGLSNGTTYTFTVTATNSNGSGPASASSNLATPLASTSCPCTMFGSSIPATPDAGDGSSVDLGMAFTSDRNGSIVGVRFYKSVANTGTHVGSLWTAGGTLLASATFTNETASGWQQVNFSSPVPVTVGTVYVVSYFAPGGHYSAAGGAFASTVTAPPLYAPASSGATPNGVYLYAAGNLFPTLTYNATNYFVDAVFQ